MSMTPLQIAEAYVAKERPYARVVKLWEDERDYFVETELINPDELWPDGPGAMFISKSTGSLRTEPWGVWNDRIDAMTPVV